MASSENALGAFSAGFLASTLAILKYQPRLAKRRKMGFRKNSKQTTIGQEKTQTFFLLAFSEVPDPHIEILSSNFSGTLWVHCLLNHP